MVPTPEGTGPPGAPRSGPMTLATWDVPNPWRLLLALVCLAVLGLAALLSPRLHINTTRSAHHAADTPGADPVHQGDATPAPLGNGSWQLPTC